MDIPHHSEFASSWRVKCRLQLLVTVQNIKHTNRIQSRAYTDPIPWNGLSLFTDLQWEKLKLSHTITTNVPYKDVVEDQQHSRLLQGDLKISHVHKYFPQIYTDIRRLTAGIRCDKCVVRWFRLCANVIECTHTNLDSIVYYTPCLYIAYCF
jgi:hypothetical protein